MKRISVYLHQNIIDTIRCFGELSEVCNRILSCCIELEEFYEETIPAAPDRQGAKRRDIYVEEDVLLQLNGFRIRSILYWFVENEIYDSLSWNTINLYGIEAKDKLKRQYDKTFCELEKLNTMSNNTLSELLNKLTEWRNQYVQ